MHFFGGTGKRAAFGRVEQLGGVEAVHRDIAEISDTLIIDLQPERVGPIINKCQIMLTGNDRQCIDITGNTEHMHGNDGRSARSDGRFNSFRGKRHADRIDVGKNRRGTGPAYGMGSGRERERCGNNFTLKAQNIAGNK